MRALTEGGGLADMRYAIIPSLLFEKGWEVMETGTLAALGPSPHSRVHMQHMHMRTNIRVLSSTAIRRLVDLVCMFSACASGSICHAVPCRAVPEGAVLRAWESHLQSHLRSCFSAKSRQIKTDTPERAHMEFGNTDRGLTHPERLIHVHGPGRPLAPSRAPCSDLFARPASWSTSPHEWLKLGGFAWQVHM